MFRKRQFGDFPEVEVPQIEIKDDPTTKDVDEALGAVNMKKLFKVPGSLFASRYRLEE